jgi:hypothetical protein
VPGTVPTKTGLVFMRMQKKNQEIGGKCWAELGEKGGKKKREKITVASHLP